MAGAAKQTLPPNTFRFTLVLAIPELTEAVLDALFAAGCDDALPGVYNGEVFLDFTRNAGSYDEAIRSAIADVKAAGFDARLAEVP